MEDFTVQSIIKMTAVNEWGATKKKKPSSQRTFFNDLSLPPFFFVALNFIVCLCEM